MATTSRARRPAPRHFRFPALLPLLALAVALTPVATAYMQDVQGGANPPAGGAATAYAQEVQAGANPQASGADGGAGGGQPTTDFKSLAADVGEIVPGMDTADILKMLSGETIVNDNPGTPWSAKRPETGAGGFQVSHDHEGDGHMCDPGAALSHLQTLRASEKKAGARAGKGKGGKKGGGGDDADAQSARVGFEQCINEVMPGLMTAADFSKPIMCHTKVARAKLLTMRRTADQWSKRLSQTSGRNVIGVATKTHRAILLHNGFAACLKVGRCT